MLKKFCILLLTSIMIFMFAGCKKASVEDPVKSDLMSYMNRISEAVTLEEDVLNDYRKVSGENYKEVDTYVVIKKIIIPKYTEFINKLDDIKPKTDEVKQLHEIYVKAAHVRLESFKQMEEGFEKKDGNLIKKTDKKLQEAQNNIEKYKKQLVELGQKHNIKVNIK
ncbi:hypothetical protein [Clostridium sp. ZS2-4]|uniref:hypothetical protein n=1 Tax=Clostridium sp. ZS2-4 TaxID=2987703 RepID=UPI00227A386D|nr:hypothetical protein [Clostridium sp. ZS2-4]MCY6356560.1 hypothetical protein [Clostridium sp. ZS2-4]